MDGKRVKVENSSHDGLCGGQLLARHENQRECLDDHRKEGGEGRNAGNVRGEPVEMFQETGA